MLWAKTKVAIKVLNDFLHCSLVLAFSEDAITLSFQLNSLLQHIPHPHKTTNALVAGEYIVRVEGEGVGVVGGRHYLALG